MQVGTYTAFHFASPVHKCISAVALKNKMRYNTVVA